MAPSEELCCLNWNSSEENLSLALMKMRQDNEFFNVTLVSDDGRQIQAHNVVLAASSPWFKSILKRNPHDHPLIYLKGVQHTHLANILEFMYNGEVSVREDHLDSFLAISEDLKVKGLTQDEEQENNFNLKINLKQEHAENSSLSKKENMLKTQCQGEENIIDNNKTFSIEAKKEENGNETQNEEVLKAFVDNTKTGQVNPTYKQRCDVFMQYLTKQQKGKLFKCNFCEKIGRRKYVMINHVESIHQVGRMQYKCIHCPKILNTYASIDNHKVYHQIDK